MRHLAALVTLLHHSDDPTEQVFLTDGSLLLSLVITHARLAQLATTLDETHGTKAPDGTPTPTLLHVVGKRDLVEGMVLGRAARALCGTWFVPHFDASSGLPICTECEAAQPVAQAVLDRLRHR